MILAINLNAALDRVFFIDHFTPDAHIRVAKTDLCIGGKGLDTALVLQTIGAETRAISFIAGKNGEILKGLLDKSNIPHELIWVNGETREANIIVETDLNRHTHLTTYGYGVTGAECDLLLEKITKSSKKAKWGIMAGSLPSGAPIDIYARIIQSLRINRVKTLIDHFGEPLLIALKEKPDIVKMNQVEFQDTFKVALKGLDEWISACKFQMETHQIDSFVITCGKEGILAFTPEGIFQAGCSKVIKEINAAGAGDAVSAAIVNHLANGESWSSALAWAAATGAAVALTESTAVCYMEDIISLHPHTWVKQLE